MSSPFFSILANLDSSARAAEAQLDRLHAGLEVNEQLLIQSIRDACRHAASLSELIRAEQPAAQWNDRSSLENLIQELKEAADARRRQELRERLLELANELEAGRVKHRFETRTAQLDTLRLAAVSELHAQAANPGQPPELPGPEASEWLVWAFNLQDERDAAVLGELRSNFAALERFTGEMEQIYWLAGRPARSGSPPLSPPPSAGSSHPPSVKPNPDIQHEPLTKSNEAIRQVEDPRKAADIPGAFAVAYEPPTSWAPAGSSRTEMSLQWQANTATATLEPAFVPTETTSGSESATGVTAPEETPPKLGVIPELSLSDEVAAETAEAQSSRLDSPSDETQPAPSAIVAEPESEETETPWASFIKLVPWRRKSVVFWAAASGFIVLSALFFAIIYHLHGRSSSKPVPTVQAANVGVAPENQPSETMTEGAPATMDAPKANPPAVSPDKLSPQGPLLHRQPAEGAQDSILLSVENCNRGQPGNIECWGYVSNLGGASSRVSLDRIDVVDGRGNSFSLDHNGQFAFSTGQSSNIPAGTRVRYTVKVPDKDVEARTLTLYMDLSNPRSLEYTFRDVPVAQ